jgi:hypothetical protein
MPESDDLVLTNREDHHPIVLVDTAILAHRASVLAFDHDPIILGGDLEQLETLRLHVLTEFLEERCHFLFCPANRRPRDLWGMGASYRRLPVDLFAHEFDNAR